MSNREKLTDESLMPMGKFKGKEKMANVPAWWYESFKHNNQGKKLYGTWKQVMDYIDENWDVIEKELADAETNRIYRRMLSRRG